MYGRFFTGFTEGHWLGPGRRRGRNQNSTRDMRDEHQHGGERESTVTEGDWKWGKLHVLTRGLWHAICHESLMTDGEQKWKPQCHRFSPSFTPVCCCSHCHHVFSVLVFSLCVRLCAAGSKSWVWGKFYLLLQMTFTLPNTWGNYSDKKKSRLH